MEDTYLKSDRGISTDKILITHMGEESLSDSFGDKNLFHAASHRTHQLPNTVDKRLFCIQCDKTFSKSSCMKKHKLVHAGGKQFTCDQCDKIVLGQVT